MNNLPPGVTQGQIDRALGAESREQEKARELVEEIEVDWNDLWHEIKAATQSQAQLDGKYFPGELERVLKEIRERYT